MISTVLVFLLATPTLGSRDADSLLAEYKPHFEKVHSVYSRLRATWVDDSPNLPGGQGRWVTKYLGWDARRRFVRTYEGQRSPVNGFNIAAFAEPETILVVDERESGPPMTLPRPSSLAKGKFELDTLVVQAIHQMTWFGEDCTLWEFLQRRRNGLICRDVADGIEVQVPFHETESRNGSNIRVVFDTRRAWTPIKFVLTSLTANRFEHTVELRYEGEWNGVPLAKQCRFFQKNSFSTGPAGTGPTGKSQKPYLEYNVLEIVPLVERPNDKEFAPENFGIIPYAPSKPAGGIPLWAWLAIAGVALVAASEAWRRSARKRRSLSSA